MFSVKAVMEPICRQTPGLTFVVPLSLKSAFLHKIQVLTKVDPEQMDDSVF